VTEDERAFLAAQRLCIVGVARKSGPPHLTPVYYALDGDDIIISTTASRFKSKVVRRNPEVSLCVIGERQPFPYLLVYGKGSIEDPGTVDAMMKIGERMTGNPIPDSARPAVEQRARDEGRVVLRVKVQRVGGGQGISTRPA
jgi:PPOX class probable F420-dependent enzyme